MENLLGKPWSGKGIRTGRDKTGNIISPEEINAFLPIVAVIPLTSLKAGRRIYPTEAPLLKSVTGLEKDSIAMSHQIRVISKARLIKQCGVIDSEDIKNTIRSIVKLFLDL